MNYTQNYQLPQWESSDRILMDDFNDAMEKIEGGLEEKVGVVFGVYDGSGSDNRTINLGFRPKVVYLCTEFGQTSNNVAYYGGLALVGHPARGTSNVTGDVNLITIVDNGFKVRNGSVQSGSGHYLSANLSGTTYHYIALR